MSDAPDAAALFEGYDGLPLAADAREALRYAAWVGALGGLDAHVHFTALLLGLAFARTPLGVSLERYLERCKPGLPALFERLRLAGGRAGEVEKAYDSGAWPPGGKAPYSASAQAVLAAAAQAAREDDHPVIGAWQLLRAFALPHAGHERDLLAWGIDREELLALLRAAPAAAPAAGTGVPEGGEDAPAYVHSGADIESVLRAPDLPSAPAGPLGARWSDEARHVLRATLALALPRESPRLAATKRADAATAPTATPAATPVMALLCLAESGFAAPPFAFGAALREELARRPRYAAELDQLRLRAAAYAPPAFPSPPFTAGETLPGADAELQAVLARAVELAAAAPHADGTVGPEHLAIALATAPGFAALAERLELRPAEFRKRLYRLLRRAPRPLARERLAAWLLDERPAAPVRYCADRVDHVSADDDRLDVLRFARAFAATAAARAVEPPLSIAVFGDWGSGKSTFMHLLEGELAAFAARGRGGELAYCGHVVPVWFNAWHYADANLWASLVFTLFEELDHHVGGRQADADAATRADFGRLLQTFEVAGVLQAEAEVAQALAAARVDSAQAGLAEAERTARARAQAFEQLARDGAVVAFRQALGGSDDVARVAAAADALGLGGLAQAVRSGQATHAEVQVLLDEARAAQLRARGALDWLLRAPLRAREWALLVLGVLALGAGGYGLYRVLAFDPTLARFTTAFGEVAAALVLGVGWARDKLATVGRALDALDGLRQQVAARIEQRVRSDAAVQAAQCELDAARLAVEAARARVAEAEAERQRAAQALKAGLRAVRLAQFIQQRLDAQDYEKQLGLISTIRRDLTLLGAFLNPPGARASAEEQNARARLQAAGIAVESRPVDRIVLFIDDLDRCPPERVVQVLEAIHLLLALPLFVVVVGVDMRWVVNALHQRFADQLDSSGDGGSERASALDYLEKIFQLAFWLPPLDAGGGEEMLDGLLRPWSAPAAGDAAVPAAAAPPGVAAGAPAAAITTDGTATAPSAAADAAGAAGAGATPSGGAATPAAAADGATVVTDLSAAEEGFMRLLAQCGALGRSPRRLKRFVNTYRVLRAAVREDERERFFGELPGAGHRQALCLLAANIGAPQSADALFHLLRAGSAGLAEAVDALGPEAPAVLDRIASAWAGGGATPVPAYPWPEMVERIARFGFRSGT
ncbi:KAP-like P-loop domain-containing protein [Plasticicumulans lactativorans]|uniref:KAP-like P-loop domain-containing protein n=1 Tax=Plasticicumulans lactativorans TaxID=1133106 RepID=A0A4R2LA70_9GAMM|nr:P-loop NTPase fold protein [Plasticicumulans lactativorans]TCO81192.1 KAP-like P-loop domain-containing protein [Plasticicumulans lactativorans]